MPDRFNFDHLPFQGNTYHRCIEVDCGWPGWGQSLSEDTRRQHFEQHERARRKAAKVAKNKALHAARQAAAEKRRENKIAYGRSKG